VPTKDNPKPPVVLVTGGLSGIGAAVARRFAAIGAQLVLCDRSDEHSAAVIHDVEATGGQADVEIVDVRDAQALRQVAARSAERHDRIDVLVAGAGISEQGSIASGDPERWRAVIDTNLLGTVYAVHAVLPHMLRQRSGHVFVLASVSGREAYAGEAVYIASKWGQVGFAHSLREEVMDHGVRVSAVEPGLVDTPLTRDNPAVKPLLDAVEPLVPDDVAEAIAYAYAQPPHVVVSELTIRPIRQRLPRF
jgi:NADP-dependent 3-hydroxy acid dehydrogenase YdfG